MYARFRIILLTTLVLFGPLAAVSAADAPRRFPLTIMSNEGAAGQPVRFSATMPFAPGELVNPANIRLLDGNREIPCDATPISGWRDKSLRSVLLQFETISPTRRKVLAVEYGPGVRRSPWPSDLQVTLNSGSGGLLANRFVRLEFGPAGAKRVRWSVEGHREQPIDMGSLAFDAVISGQGRGLRGILADSPAQYTIVQRTPRYVTVREEHCWGAHEGKRAPWRFVLEYTLWAGNDSVDIKAFLWPTSAAGRGTSHAARTKANGWHVRRVALAIRPAFDVRTLHVGTDRMVDFGDLSESGDVFFSRTAATDPRRVPIDASGQRIESDWQVDLNGKTTANGTGQTGQYVIYCGSHCALQVVFKDFDAWGAWKYRDAYMRFQRNCWNAHFLAKNRYLAAGILDYRRDTRIGRGDPNQCPFAAYAGQRWAWHLTLRLTPGMPQEPLAYSRAVARPLPYLVPYSRWVAARYLPEKETLPQGLLNWIEILAPEADMQRWPGGPDVTFFGHRPWYEPMLFNWMRHGEPKFLHTFLRLTEQNDHFETCFDPYGKSAEGLRRSASMDGLTFTRGWGPVGSSFYSNPTVALLGWLMTGDPDFLASHEKQLWRIALITTPEGFIHDKFEGDPQGRKHKSQGRAGSVCQCFFDEDQLRQAKYAEDRSWLNLGTRIYRYFSDFAFSHEDGEEGFVYWWAHLGARTYQDGLAIDYAEWKKPKDAGPVHGKRAWLRYLWMFFHWSHAHAEYYGLTGDDEILHYLPQFARVWIDPRSTGRVEKEGRAFRNFPPGFQGHAKVGGSLQAISAAHYTDDSDALSIGKKLLALALSPTHLWRYHDNPDIHPNEEKWYGKFLLNNILPGSAKWGQELRRNMASQTDCTAQRMGHVLAIAVDMGNPFVFAHDLERYWYLDQGGKYAVVDDHTKPFDPMYYDKDDSFPNNKLINPATEKILKVTDIGSRQTCLQIAADPGSLHGYWYWSPAKPQVAVTGGSIEEQTYDPANQTGKITVKHDASGKATLTLAHNQDKTRPTVRRVWIRNGKEPYLHSELGGYRKVLTTMINPDVDYKAIRAPHARVLTNERTTAKLYYTQTPGQAGSWQVISDDVPRFNHRFGLGRLPPGKWYLRLAVADDSDNTCEDDNHGGYYVLVIEKKPVS